MEGEQMPQSFMFITVMPERAYVSLLLICMDLRLKDVWKHGWLMCLEEEWWLNTYSALAKHLVSFGSIGESWQVTYGMCNLLEQQESSL